jgi:hypothetical protein
VISSPLQPTSDLPLAPPDTRHSRDLFHPLCDLAFVEVVQARELYAPRRLAIPTGVTGGAGLSATLFTNMSLTWLAKPPQQKHQPSPTP